MPSPLAPEVRSQFAKRLKEMRVQSGFLRARYFAKALGIEENRYTRYERAEVEPSLTLINKICETLRVSPNQLLGFAESASLELSGFGEGVQRADDTGEDGRKRQLGLLAWRLASEMVAIRSSQRTAKNVPGDPLAATRDIGSLFRKLREDPFGTVAEIVADEALKRLDSERKTELADLIEAYTENAAKASRQSTG